MLNMSDEEFYNTIKKYGGIIDGGINWTWAKFPNDIDGLECFRKLSKHCWEHRGYYPAEPNSPNSNLHQGGFRFR